MLSAIIMARGENMVVEKAWVLSNDDKKTIKENAQKIKVAE